MIFSRILPILMIVAAAGLFIGYTQPTYGGAIAELATEIDGLDRALEAAKQFKVKESKLLQERESISSEQLERVQAFLPDSVDNVQLIVDLNSLAARSGVQLSDFDIANDSAAAPTTDGSSAAPLALTSAEPTDSLELSVSAMGSYAGFRTFLDGVEKSLRPLDIVELSVEDSETGVYKYDVTFRLYWLR